MTYFLAALVCLLGYALFSTISRNRNERRLHAISKQQLKEDYEQVAKRHEHEFARLLDALPDPFISISEKGRIIRHNRPVAEIFQGRKILGRSFPQVLLDPALIAEIEKATDNACAISTALSFPPTSPFSDKSLGKESHWKIDLRPLSLNRDTLEIQLIMRNITAEVQTDQIRKDFVANASHELRTPLSIIAGYLENLTEEGGLDNKEVAQNMLSTMDRHVVRINRIVEDMLVISKLESNEGTPLKMESFNLAVCIRDVVERLDLLIVKQKATVRINAPEVTLTGDRFYWTQILFNLIENAL
ncbi:PAS domain-containing protein, partial [Akkermansiaceae bacterium]|nr:PAS domain-containing protein [Akkermansiaceae bacterium]